LTVSASLGGRLIAAIQSLTATLVLSGLVAGLANKTIVFDLDISPRTVEVLPM
jgi:FixJ family two-component response regulator